MQISNLLCLIQLVIVGTNGKHNIEKQLLDQYLNLIRDDGNVITQNNVTTFDNEASNSKNEKLPFNKDIIESTKERDISISLSEKHRNHNFNKTQYDTKEKQSTSLEFNSKENNSGIDIINNDTSENNLRQMHKKKKKNTIKLKQNSKNKIKNKIRDTYENYSYIKRKIKNKMKKYFLSESSGSSENSDNLDYNSSSQSKKNSEEDEQKKIEKIHRAIKKQENYSSYETDYRYNSNEGNNYARKNKKLSSVDNICEMKGKDAAQMCQKLMYVVKGPDKDKVDNNRMCILNSYSEYCIGQEVDLDKRIRLRDSNEKLNSKNMYKPKIREISNTLEKRIMKEINKEMLKLF